MSAAAMTMRSLITKVVIGAAFLSAPAWADPVPRIGALVPTPANSPQEQGLRDGLRELGYVEGKNIVIEWRRTGGANAELRSLTTDLVHSKPDVIVVFTTPAARAALEATTIIPVVFLSGDPVASGLAVSLARPGGNATGVSGLMAELTAKRLELLQQVAPRARRIACLMNSSNPSGVQQLEAAQTAARTLGMQLVTLDARNEAELDVALHTLSRSVADGILVGADVLFRANKSEIAQAVRKARLPGTFSLSGLSRGRSVDVVRAGLERDRTQGSRLRR